ncbi:MAG TPA: rod-binding protein [Verrucomicrobiae bacterium]|jgi:Rod binding domain-containing protein|nr:rod-binding protein [Verrucomicrobiae bacterium]
MNIHALKPHVVASDIAPDRLANNPDLTERQKISEASRQFESILLKQILESSQKTVIKSKYSEDSTASGIYHDMITTQLADSISKSGTFGLAKVFEQQLNRPEVASKGDKEVSTNDTQGQKVGTHSATSDAHKAILK